MSWIIIAILAYLILAVVFLIDKYLLTTSIPNPKKYAFYIGFLGIVALTLIPFVEFSFPGYSQLALSFAAGAVYVLALVWFFKGLQLFEASRITPAIGGLIPIFNMLLVLVFFGEVPSSSSLFAFFLLVAGTVLITYQKKKITFSSLKISAISAFFWALHFILIKYVYLEQDFWPGFIWIKIGGTLAALLLLFSQEVRIDFFKQKAGLVKKTAVIFFLNQGAGALANILQNWAVALAPLAAVALVPAFQGMQYVFLLIIAILISFRFPQFLKEETSREVVFQKLLAVLFIAGGIYLLLEL